MTKYEITTKNIFVNSFLKIIIKIINYDEEIWHKLMVVSNKF